MQPPLPVPRWHLGSAWRWVPRLLVLGVLTGSASALFLAGLDLVTRARFAQPAVLYLLPVAGAFIGWIYARHGQPAAAGNHLVLRSIHDGETRLPGRMAPMILLATWITHLFGGSAGREGTAVQMGGGIAGMVGRWFAVTPDQRRVLHMAGVAAGFGAVFGTPWAGALFAMEVPVAGRIQWRGTMVCLVASFAGDWSCRAWGIHHTAWPVIPIDHSPWQWPAGWATLAPLGKSALAAVVFGLVAAAFCRSLHHGGRAFGRWFPSPVARPFVGGLVIIALVHLLGTRAYLGLGVWSSDPNDPILTGFLHGPADDATSWAWKLLFTVVTLASGFKGGEVTPLFFIGAGLGHALSGPLGLPVDMLAALGMVAVFAGAAKTPWACAVMGAELFGPAHAPAFALVTWLAVLASGKSGIYAPQKNLTLLDQDS